MANASGVAKKLRYKKESDWGDAPGTSGGQSLRRRSSDLDLKKETYESEEIRSDYQVSDFRHGVRSIDGGITGEISPGTYKDFMAAAVRQAWQAAPTSSALTNVTAQAADPQYARAAGSWITNGFKVGQVIRWGGWASPAAANNAKNFLITGLTATDMTGVHLDGSAVVAKASGDSVTATLYGKQTWAPQTGHTDDSFAIEHWYSDIEESELFLGCKVATMAFDLPPTGISTIAMTFMGKDVTTDDAEYYVSPAAETTSGVIAAVNGKLYVGGVEVAVLTGLSFSIEGGMTAEPVVGSNTYSDINEGRIRVTGQMTAYFQDVTFRDLFINETESSVIAVFTTNNSATADFIAFVLPRIKAGGASKDDGEKSIVQTIPFTALLNGAGGSGTDSEKTTISIQDSTVS